MESSHSFMEENTKIRAGRIASKKTKKLKILKVLRRFVHACQCVEQNCEKQECNEKKSLVVHSKMCTRTPKKDCDSCQQLIALCRYHAKYSQDCESIRCAVPFCAKIKHSLKLQKMQNKQSCEKTDNDVSEVEIEVVLEDANIRPHISDYSIASTSFEPQVEVSQPPVIIQRTPQSTSNWEPPYIGTLEENRVQLRKLLHAHQCLLDENQAVVNWPCFESHCGATKVLLQHIFNCQVGRQCTFSASCMSSKSLLMHCKNCVDIQCELCRPVKQSLRIFRVQLPEISWGEELPPISTVPTVEAASSHSNEIPQDLQDLTIEEIFPSHRPPLAIPSYESSHSYCCPVTICPKNVQMGTVLQNRQTSQNEAVDLSLQHGRQGLQRLKQLLQLPQTSEQHRQRQILQLLKANPNLMSAFVRQRLQRQQQVTTSTVASPIPSPL